MSRCTGEPNPHGNLASYYMCTMVLICTADIIQDNPADIFVLIAGL